MIKSHRIIALLFLLSLFFNGCDIPRDPNDTLKSIRGKTLKVGIMDQKPWASYNDGHPTGVEVEIVKAIAHDLKAEIEWEHGAESQLMKALEAKELHLVIGGIEKSSPWSQHVGFTNPYKKVSISVGVTHGMSVPKDIEDMEVSVERGSEIARFVKKEGGKPVRVERVQQSDGLIAAPDWHIRQLGMQQSDIELHTQEMVLAIAQGENAWVMYLEKFFKKHSRQIDEWLMQNSETAAQ